jgi:hypothetical protein
MTSTQTAPDAQLAPSATDGGVRHSPPWQPALSRAEVAFLIAVPLLWAVLLLFHPAPDKDDIYSSLRNDATAYLIVHLGTVAFIGLMGYALYLLVRGVPGTAARIARLAIGPFVVFYAAGEAILGIAAGVLVRDANDSSEGPLSASAEAATTLWNNAISADLLPAIGSVAWIVATLATAVTYRRLGAPLAIPILIAVSSLAILHAPPPGPFALVCFAAAVVLLTRGRRV